MITSTEPKLDTNGRYSIAETCELLGIHRNTLSAYVKADYIRPMTRKRTTAMQSSAPRPRFLGSEILRFWRTFV